MIKHLRLGFLTLVLTFCWTSHGNWYIPTHAPMDSIVLENPTSQDIDVWTQGPITEGPIAEEVSWTVSPRSLLRISLASLGHTPFVNIKTHEGSKLKVHSLFKDQKNRFRVLDWTSDASDSLELSPSLSFTSSGNVLRLVNLSASTNQVEVLYRQGGQAKKLQVTVPPMEEAEELLVIDPLTRIQVQGSQRLQALLHTSKFMIENFNTLPSRRRFNGDPNQTYFLIADGSFRQSYVVAITDPAIIDKARAIIANPQGQFDQIISARIELGNNMGNRDLLNPLRAPWSWTAEVKGIKSFGSTACNGTAQDLEDYLIPWIRDIGTICFWNYRVIKELKPNEIW